VKTIGTNAQIILWITIGIIAIAIDLVTSNLLFIWFTIGCLASLIAIILKCPLNVQIITFLITSTFFIIIGYPLAKETLKKSVKKIETMEEKYINRVITVNENIDNKSLIKLDGIYWTVVNCGKFLKKGDKAKIIRIDGNKLIINKYEGE